MDERTDLNWNSKRIKVNPPVTQESKTARLVLLRNAHYKIYGSVTGKEYFFHGAGYSLDIDERDVPALLAMRRNSCNCSGMPGQPYFELGG